MQTQQNQPDNTQLKHQFSLDCQHSKSSSTTPSALTKIGQGLFKSQSISSLVPHVSVDLGAMDTAAQTVGPSPVATTCGGLVMQKQQSDLLSRDNTGAGFMTVTSAASVSKGDIELLENKIQVLEKQISKIKKKHTEVLSDCSIPSKQERASYPMPTADIANNEFMMHGEMSHNNSNLQDSNAVMQSITMISAEHRKEPDLGEYCTPQNASVQRRLLKHADMPADHDKNPFGQAVGFNNSALMQQNTTLRDGLAAFQQATHAESFFSPLKQKRAQKMFNSSAKSMRRHQLVTSQSFTQSSVLPHQSQQQPPQSSQQPAMRQSTTSKADYMAQQVQKLQLDLQSIQSVSQIKANCQQANAQRKPKQPQYIDELVTGEKKRHRRDTSEAADSYFYEGYNSKQHRRKPTFDSVKKKLTFDEDLVEKTTLPLEEGSKMFDQEPNPFLQMLDCQPGVPQFHHTKSTSMGQTQFKSAASPIKKSHLKAHLMSMTQQREGTRGQHLANQHDTLEQLDGVLNSMFKLIGEDVEPFMDDQQARQALRSYKSLTKNLMKSLKIQKNKQQDPSSHE